jgi:hypothetical protein
MKNITQNNTVSNNVTNNNLNLGNLRREDPYEEVEEKKKNLRKAVGIQSAEDLFSKTEEQLKKESKLTNKKFTPFVPENESSTPRNEASSQVEISAPSLVPTVSPNVSPIQNPTASPSPTPTISPVQVPTSDLAPTSAPFQAPTTNSTSKADSNAKDFVSSYISIPTTATGLSTAGLYLYAELISGFGLLAGEPNAAIGGFVAAALYAGASMAIDYFSPI